MIVKVEHVVFGLLVMAGLSSCVSVPDSSSPAPSRGPASVPEPAPAPPPPPPLPAPSPVPASEPKTAPVMLPSGAPDAVRASRIFAGPDQYPPENFAAYGIVAFRSRPVSTDRARFLMICEAYVGSLPHASELSVPRTEQMVTIWPVETNDWADRINISAREAACAPATGHYGLVMAQKAIKDAELAGEDITGAGPFLLAWAPAKNKGQPGAPVLVSNLSDVTTALEARDIFTDWVQDIEQDSTLWHNGWNLERVRQKLRQWADKYGGAIMRYLSGEA